MKILLIDHSRTMRNTFKSTLRQIEPVVDFLEAGDGAEAMALVAAGRTFDIALIDWNLRGMDGLSLVQKIRRFDKYTPLIMCTADASKVQILLALKAGVNNYLVKPFSSETLIEKVQTTLQKAHVSPMAMHALFANANTPSITPA